MRLTLIISGIAAGGAERVLSIMANHWAEHGTEVTLLTLDAATNDFYALSPRITRVGLDILADSHGAAQAIGHNLTRIRSLRHAIQASRPDAIISFIDTINVLVLLAAWKMRVPVVVSERIDPRYHRIGRLWNALRRLTYPFAQAVVVQTEEVKQWALRILPRGNVLIIPNPVATPPTAGDEVDLPVGPIVIGMGRLHYQKGFDLLLRAFKNCAAVHPEWSLVLLGEGSARAGLEMQAVELGLQDKVHFAGRIKQPASYLRKADLFVLSSRFEGFPNALLEAMACGLPVISFDCPSGPGDIVTNGVDGILVPMEDVDKLGKAMSRLMSDSPERLRLGEQAVRSLNRFELGTIMSMWDSVLTDAVAFRAQNGASRPRG